MKIEEGQFLGLDFSGPTIKVVLVLLQNRQCTMTRKFYDIPTRYMTGKSVKVRKIYYHVLGHEQISNGIDIQNSCITVFIKLPTIYYSSFNGGKKC